MNSQKRWLIKTLVLFFLMVQFGLIGVANPTPIECRNALNSTTTVGFDSERWHIKDPKGRVEEHLGRRSLYLTAGYAYLKDVEFENGVIEVDIAPPTLRSFMGIVFRFESVDEHEIVYFRPHKSGLDDAVQYAPSLNGSTPWQLYSGKGYTTATDIPNQRWVHVRIEIAGLGGKVYLNNAPQPVLVIEDLKRGYSRGSVGLWGGANGGHFANFTYTVEPVSARPERQPQPIPAAIIKRWELSEAFEVEKINPETLPAAAELNKLKWDKASVEAPGMLVINRYRRAPEIVRFFVKPEERSGKREGRRAVYARAVIYSDRGQTKRMSFGYSDEATVFLNGQPLFTGKSAFRFRDPGFLGIMDVENDAVYLNLKKGRNELILGVADYFGGWGLICRLDDLQGIRLE
ncbi:MAG: hypothetical protein AB1757_01395 [Acidobacteriota bacterium]